MEIHMQFGIMGGSLIAFCREIGYDVPVPPRLMGIFAPRCGLLLWLRYRAAKPESGCLAPAYSRLAFDNDFLLPK